MMAQNIEINVMEKYNSLKTSVDTILASNYSSKDTSDQLFVEFLKTYRETKKDKSISEEKIIANELSEFTLQYVLPLLKDRNIDEIIARIRVIVDEQLDAKESKNEHVYAGSKLAVSSMLLKALT